jgi:hypothetical protein
VPGVPGVTASPYPFVSDVMNLARVRACDTSFGLDGDLLANDRPDTLTMLNASWRWLQRKAANAGIETYIQEVFLTGLPAGNAYIDLVNQSFIGWQGCGDGIYQFDAPALPQDMYIPLSVWARQSGTQNEYFPMLQAENGLPTWLNYNIYDWRTDGLFYYGNTYPLDFRIRYSAMRDDLNFDDPTMQVTMRDCQDALSARVAYEYVQKRGGTAAPTLAAMAETAFATMTLTTGRRKQRMSIRRIGFSGRGRRSIWPVIRNP